MTSFLLLMAIAALLRFPNLSEKGLYYHDEASFMSVGRFYAGIITYALTNALKGDFSSASVKSKIIQLKQMGGSTLEAARPLFSAALILTMTLFGDKDSVGLLFSAVVSLLTLLLFYSFGRDDSARFPYLIAALLLSLSVWHVQYSRCVLSQSLSLFFVTWTMLEIVSGYQRRGDRPMNIRRIGLLTGLTFNTHYSLFWLPILVACWLAYVEWQGMDGIRTWRKKMVTTAIFMSLSSIAFEVWYEILYFVSLRFTPGDLHRRAVLTYGEQIINQLSYPWGKPDTPYTLFMTFLGQTESAPFLIALLAGFLYLAWTSRKSALNALLLLWILVPVFVWGTFRYSAPRSYLPCLAPAILGSGMFFHHCRRWSRFEENRSGLRDAVIACCLVVVGVSQVVRILPLLDAVSPYKLASKRIQEFCRKNPGYEMYKPDLGVYAAPLLRYYLGDVVVEKEPVRKRLVITDYFSPKEPVQRVNGEAPILLGCVSAPLEKGMILYDAFYWRMVERYRNGELRDDLCVYRSSSS